MNILTLDHISKNYIGRMLLDDASLYLEEGEKVGIIGINGTGKSTLLKIIAGLEEPDAGKVILANNHVVSYLPQTPQFDPEETVINSVVKACGGHDEYGSHESDAKTMLTKLGITDFDQKCGELSGGQKKRLALVAVLMAPCDILVLDEPTNHLDSEMSEWLEEYLRAFRKTLVMVTHDRYFLDSVCRRIVEIDKGHIYSYDANYSGFLSLKAQREQSMLASERKRQSILRKEIAWIQRGARARSTKQKAHIQRYEALRDMDAPEFDGQVEISSVSSRLGKTIVELKAISKAYGDKVLIKDFTYLFLKGDRIGFVGPNGCGKTTLMKMIDSRVRPDAGEIVIGQTVKIGYYTQEIEENEAAGVAYMNPNDKVIDYIRNVAEYVRTEDGQVSASAMLERFLFTADQQYSPIAKLSGGEKRRLNLLRVLMGAPNVLILDEPTNDLDIKTLQILEDYLDNYQGVVITVSHDRYFLDRVVRRIFAFEGDGVLRQYEGGYTDYENRKQEEGTASEDAEATHRSDRVDKAGRDGNAGTATTASTNAKTTWTHEKKLKFTYNEQKEYDTIDEVIAKLEQEIADIDTDMAKNATNSAKLIELSQLKEQKENDLEHKMERWVYLNELAERIAAQ
ncbi:MAG: ABC-F family ATP-binding cassette domain-containing protein [Lachnospiraceae bacterium]|nr:ABC-F family ATP-binding cassette domain-containing protein [Lachnospiraceae bacterium]